MKRPWLLPLAPLWAVGSAWKNRAFDHGSAKTERLELPVLSVGSLSAGGAGKTPFVIALGEALRRSGFGFDVLSRGYGRPVDAGSVKRVIPSGSAAEFGDEPLLIARSLGRRVYVGADRAQSGRMAEREHRALRESGPWVHLLDDGFQHRRLARSVDVVLLTQADLRDTLLPAGDLREPLRSLRRADVVVVRREEAAEVRAALERVFQSRAMPPVWEIERRFVMHGNARVAAPFAFCGLARPVSFQNSLRQHGVQMAGWRALRDHQVYDDALVERLLEAARRSGADGWVTTAKDAVKLTPALERRLGAVGPVLVADLSVLLLDEAGAIEDIRRLLTTASAASA